MVATGRASLRYGTAPDGLDLLDGRAGLEARYDNGDLLGYGRATGPNR